VKHFQPTKYYKNATLKCNEIILGGHDFVRWVPQVHDEMLKQIQRKNIKYLSQNHELRWKWQSNGLVNLFVTFQRHDKKMWVTSYLSGGTEEGRMKIGLVHIHYETLENPQWDL
jgi:hypothetical protein